MVVFYKHTIKVFVMSALLRLCLRTCAMRPVRHTIQYPLKSLVPKVKHEAWLRALEGRFPSSKSPSRAETDTREVLGGIEDNNIVHCESLICLPGKNHVFTKSKEK